MKNTIPPLLLLIVLLGFCLQTAFAIDADTRDWRAQLQQADSQIRSEQWVEAQETLEHSYESWLSRLPYLRIVAVHSMLDEANCLYRRVIAFSSVQEPAELLADLHELDQQLELLALWEQPSLSYFL